MKTKASISKHSLEWMPKKVWAQAKWAELHCRALAYLPMEGEQEWFDNFVENIPCPHCLAHFRIFLEKNPPDFSSRPAFFRFTVCAHNYVSRSLGKPEMTVTEALLVHSGQWQED